MTEDAVPYVGENDPPKPQSMVERVALAIALAHDPQWHGTRPPSTPHSRNRAGKTQPLKFPQSVAQAKYYQ